ncbi:MAG: AbrB family transcriptional regulator [Hyphomicrobiales bacterium]|nr:AbrB family transcriptional regulator [Hyphomicrobiales bacterium]
MQPRALARIIETFLIAALGGLGFQAVGFPGGLVSGSMLLVAIAALAGRPMVVPAPLARVSFVMLGALLGGVITPETLRGVATWPFSVALLAISAICTLIATTCYLRLVHRWDLLSALLGASPGSMAQVMALSAEFGSDVRGIAVVQVMRVLLIVIGLPAGLALAGLTVDPVTQLRSAEEISLLELVELLGASTAVALVMLWLRFPGGLLFGAMIGSGLLHGTGLIRATIPTWAGTATVLTLGAIAGARFASTPPRMLLSYLGAALGSFAVAGAITALFALIVVLLLPVRAADVVVAFAPGAQDTMMVLALALHLDPVYVGAHHLARFLVVSFSVAITARRLARDMSVHGQHCGHGAQGTFDN